MRGEEILEEIRAEGARARAPSPELRAAFQETVRRELLVSESEAHYGGEVSARVRVTLKARARNRPALTATMAA